MAIFRKTDPLFGDVKGVIGPVVVTETRGVNVLKLRPAIDRKARRRKNKGKTKPAQNLKMGLISSFIAAIKEYTEIGFGKNRNGKAEFPLAVQYNLAHAVAGLHPNFSINYPEVVISQGNREMAWSSAITYDDSKFITVSWEIPDTANIREIGNDLAYILLYDETIQKTLYSGEKVPRSALSLRTEIYDRNFGSIIHAYLFFVSADQKSRSRSDYVGSIVIPFPDINK
ncbi:hypothetical protein SAMN06265348_10467 [Pedobacter westerhofensis]|uniref:Uncharacterized protein n=1 Tax=Pedobacter westerhofensis TaxID=425512 RepID=A0A521CNE9_9SPHI|nr:DUF6266 family protein [Pedobacter westerhofensis]SMO60918.1 hypothetical protein SAMN06265348_10467 [Pedobacter westerhofensis]